MDASNWIALAAVVISLGSFAVGYGVIKQTVAGLKETVAKQDARITMWEAAHANTSNEMGTLRVDVAVLKERSGTTITTLERIERYVTPDGRPAPRGRAVTK